MSRKHRWIVAMAALGLFVGALPASLVCAADDPAGGNPPSPRESSTRRLRIIDQSPPEDSLPSMSMLRQALIGELQSDTPKDPRPALADTFAPFKDQVKVRWDQRWLYVESNGMPAHDLMIGITNWQQQVPLPKDYTGANAWQIPLHPVPSKAPVSIKGRFLRGAIALAVNGIPIFNPQNNRGEVSQEIGELDQWGGHCGRGDDYHYHAAPIFLEKTVGKGKPIAFALDGYPIYGTIGPDGLPVNEKSLDEFHGKTDAKGNYAYYASTKYPYLNGGFHGEVTEVGGQVDPQPSGRGLRPATTPLRGVKITGFTTSKDGKTFSLKYEVGSEARFINYAINADASVKFDFVDGRGQVKTETYSQRGGGRERGAAQHLGVAEGRRRIVAPRAGDEPGIGSKGACCPFPDVAEAKAARRALMRGRLPLGFAGQATAGPAAPRVGLVPADVYGWLGLRHTGEPAEPVLQHTVA